MKLRNKNTGEVFDALIREKGGAGSYSLIVCDIKSYEQSKSTLDATHFVLDEYETLTELNEDWEDYKPAEPLIKDEKIRRAVRAWAEANEISQAQFDRYTSGFSASDDGHNLLSMISFDGFVFMFVDGKYYTIDELCGEEEE